MTHHSIFDNIIDAGAVTALAAIVVGWLPNATIILVFAVAVIRFFETATVRAALKRVRQWLLD